MNYSPNNENKIDAVINGKYKLPVNESDHFELVGRSISDLEGKYGLPLDKDGEYKVEVLASGYKKRELGIFYTDEKEFIKDVILEKLEASNESLLPKLRLYFKREMVNILNRIFVLAFGIGAFYSAIVSYYYPSTINSLFAAAYITLFLVNVFFYLRKSMYKRGRVVDSLGVPVTSVAVRVYSNNSQLGVFLTNSKGEFKVNLPAGEYLARFSKNMSNYSQNSPGQRIIIKRNGYLKEDIVLDMPVQVQNSNYLPSPFG